MYAVIPMYVKFSFGAIARLIILLYTDHTFSQPPAPHLGSSTSAC